MKIYLKLITALVFFAILSCEKEENNNSQQPASTLGPGVFIINEGTFGQGNGSVSYLSATGSQFIRDIYKDVNGIPLGDVVQSMYIYNDRAYIVVNNSQKVEVVAAKQFTSLGTITGFSSPRFFLPVSPGKAYVSDWQSNSVKVVDLNSLTVTGSIACGSGPERMLKSGNKVYVVNVGGFSNDSTVTVVDAVNDTVIKTIKTGVNPNSIVEDANGDIVVLCGGSVGPDFTGGTADDLEGSIVKIDPSADSVVFYHSLGQFYHPSKLHVNQAKNKFLLLGGNNGFTGNVSEFSFQGNVITLIIDDSFYGLGIDPSNNNIYCGRAGFTSNNYILRFTESGSLIDSVLCGIAPNSFEFLQ